MRAIVVSKEQLPEHLRGRKNREQAVQFDERERKRLIKDIVDRYGEAAVVGHFVGLPAITVVLPDDVDREKLQNEIHCKIMDADSPSRVDTIRRKDMSMEFLIPAMGIPEHIKLFVCHEANEWKRVSREENAEIRNPLVNELRRWDRALYGGLVHLVVNEEFKLVFVDVSEDEAHEIRGALRTQHVIAGAWFGYNPITREFWFALAGTYVKRDGGWNENSVVVISPFVRHWGWGHE